MKTINVSCLNDQGDEIYNYARRLKLGVEVLAFSTPHISPQTSVEQLNKQFNDFDVIAIHGPYTDLYPASIDPDISQVIFKRFEVALKAAKDIGAKHIIFHAGFIPDAMFSDQWLEQSIIFWEKFMDRVDDTIEIHIENVCERHYDLLKRLVEHINLPNFSICLDVGHVHIHSKLSIEEWIEGLHKHIGYVHLHNNNGINDLHAGIYNGSIDMLSVLQSLETFAPHATWNLETDRDETIASIDYLKEHGFIKET